MTFGDEYSTVGSLLREMGSKVEKVSVAFNARGQAVNAEHPTKSLDPLKQGLQDLEQLVNEKHRGVQVVTGYEPLAEVLKEALDQAQYGKGRKCHANGRPFLEQPIMVGGRECGPGGLAFQARKKILEALNCEDDERAIEDLLGAINYTAAMVLLRREK